ncbi:MAG: YdcF family protein [Gemmatimonadota bacterium]|nr:YdcF family protein [Gemmatimonadota bacterium]
MNPFASARARAAISGAVLGGLIWAALDELGLWATLKLDAHFSTLLVLIVVCAAAAATILRRALWAAAGLIVLLLVIVCFTPVSEALVRPLVRSDGIPAEKLDAIVVLSGGMTADHLMNPQSLDRLLEGVQLIREGKGAALVLSTERRVGNGRTVSDSADQASVLALSGVAAAVFFIDSATSTRDEALRVSRLPARGGWQRIAVVTSPLHSRRACATFERAGFQVTCLPAASRDRAIRNFQGAGDRLHAFQGWLYECAGWIKYRVSGWV